MALRPIGIYVIYILSKVSYLFRVWLYYMLILLIGIRISW